MQDIPQTPTTPAQRPDPAHDHAHVLMPTWLAPTIPPLYATDHTEDPIVWAKWFTPDSGYTWYVLEFDPVERLCFGWVVGECTELGYFDLDEVRAVRGLLGLRVERDIFWQATPLSKVQSGAVQ